jgi:hypothetical protein
MASLEDPQNPGDLRTYGPFVVTPATRYFLVQGRGRVMQVRLDANLTVGTLWRWGEPLLQISIDGRGP